VFQAATIWPVTSGIQPFDKENATYARPLLVRFRELIYIGRGLCEFTECQAPRR
jgi:hypothetical protein